MPLCKKKLAEEIDVLREISKVQQSIQRKHRLMKLGKESMEQASNDYFKPLVIPLKELAAQSVTPAVKTETAQVETKLEVKNEEKSNLQQKEEEIKGGSSDEDFKMKVPLKIENYLRIIHTKEWDSTYGIRKLKSSYKIGDSSIRFNDDEIEVGGETYEITNGLIELLIKKDPIIGKVKSSDVENYRKIIRKTNAHKKRFSPDGAIRDINDTKYRDFIYESGDEYSDNNHRGDGLLPTFMVARKNSQMNYVYWDNPNELVDRLRLLIASRAAGNPSHENEIISIIEELREAGIIY